MSIIYTPVQIIGSSSGGTVFNYDAAQSGGVLRRIGVWAGEWQLRGIRVWFTHTTSPQTFGTANVGSYKEFEFTDGERISRLSLWGNGAGTRSGGIRFITTRDRQFFHHMTSWPLKQEYVIEVASGLCVGLRGRAGADIDALGLTFLLPISHARLTNVRYPTLQLEAASIHPVNIHEFYDENLSYSLPKEWTNTGSYTKTESASWSLTTGIEYHATVGVSAGIPKIAEVSGEFGWQVGVSGTYETTWEESETYGWSRGGVIPPRTWLSFIVTTRRGNLSVPYEGTMEIVLSTGTRFSYALKGQYAGVAYTRVETRTEEGSVDAASREGSTNILRSNVVGTKRSYGSIDSNIEVVTSRRRSTDHAAPHRLLLQHNGADDGNIADINELHLDPN
ncbi:hypothetical protein KP509_09G074000 [Ceratopteris richardii]|uniref:Jacalin-type lectin domain-containing protein n=1 Tax=Ceratopteris richardii TaxID=49495 RepID=A0A8T2U9C7_CERRI|nr:hypothetical protein KP509_09G074000 [Ceratopteris richardii]